MFHYTNSRVNELQCIGFSVCRETVLVTGAAGSTGLAAVEIAAKVFKAKVSSNRAQLI